MSTYKQIVIRVTLEERERIHELAASSGMSMQSYVRRKLGFLTSPAGNDGIGPLSKQERGKLAVRSRPRQRSSQ